MLKPFLLLTSFAVFAVIGFAQSPSNVEEAVRFRVIQDGAEVEKNISTSSVIDEKSILSLKNKSSAQLEELGSRYGWVKSNSQLDELGSRYGWVKSNSQLDELGSRYGWVKSNSQLDELGSRYGWVK